MPPDYWNVFYVGVYFVFPPVWPRYLSITVRDYSVSLYISFFFFYTNRLVKAFLMGCLKHSTLWLLFTPLPFWKISLCVSTSIWQMWCSLSPSDTNPLSTVCIKWLASKTCAVLWGLNVCVCIFGYCMTWFHVRDCMERRQPRSGSDKKVLKTRMTQCRLNKDISQIWIITPALEVKQHVYNLQINTLQMVCTHQKRLGCFNPELVNTGLTTCWVNVLCPVEKYWIKTTKYWVEKI